MVVDTSVLLAVIFTEPLQPWASEQLEVHAADLRMSTVNLAETLILVRSRQPHLADEIEDGLLTSTIRFVPPDANQARVAAAARLTYPLNLGDCFAYALAKQENCSILTLDSDFRGVDVGVLLPPSGGS